MQLRALAAAAALAVGSSVAAAGVTSGTFSSDVALHNRGAFSGVATYDSSTDKLTLSVTNTTSAANGGFLTAIAFDTKTGSIAHYEDPDGGKKPNTNGFDDLIRGKRKIFQTNFGKYQAGAGLDGKWSAGKASRGIAMGNNQTFVFDVTGPSAANLTVSDFFAGGKHGLNIVASFAGMSRHRTDRAGGILTGLLSTDPPANQTGGTPAGQTSHGSDVPPPIVTITPPPTTGGNTGGDTGGTAAVPLPPAVWTGMGTLGLMGLGAVRRRMRMILG